LYYFYLSQDGDVKSINHLGIWDSHGKY